MDKKTYKKLTKGWEGKIYQEWRRMPQRIELLKKRIELFKDKNVLEFGSNGGLFCFEIMKHAKSYLGIEKYKPYYKQALKTAKYVDVSFKNMTAKEYMLKNEISCNAFLSIYVLYHLDNKEIKLLRELVWPKCDVVINMLREKGDKVIPNNDYRLWRAENSYKLVESEGFKTEVVGENPYLIVGKR